MSVSIYYTAKRKQPLTATERNAIDAAIARFAVEDQLEEYFRSGTGLNWESFCIYDATQPTEAGIVLEGATKLPDNSEDAMWIGLQHWCQLLTEIHLQLSGANWHVHVDDHAIVWDNTSNSFDPSQ